MKKHPSPNQKAMRTMGEFFTKGRNTKFDGLVDGEATERRRRIEEIQERQREKRELEQL